MTTAHFQPQPDAIVADQLHRVYEKIGRWSQAKGETVAVDNVSVAVPTGTIFGQPRPKDAGKTTTIKMLSTLLFRLYS